MRSLTRSLGSCSLVVAAFVATAVGSSAARADDSILLENGREIRGRIVEERDDLVKIDIGGGKMTYKRSQIREVRREKVAAPEAAAAGPTTPFDAAAKREETALVYVEGQRVGTRTLRTSKLPDGWLFEEEVRVLDASGAPKAETRTSERADLQFRPMSFQVRETDGVAEHRTVAGEMRGGRLWLVVTRNGEKDKTDVAAPDDARFPCAAREMFLRESRSLAGTFDAPVWDAGVGAFVKVAYREAAPRPLRVEGRSLEARVVSRKRGDVVEREWLDRDGTAVLAEIAGPSTVAIATTKGAVARLAEGDTERVTGPDSAARTTYVDKVRGWSIRKPDPTWTFEKPDAEGSAAVLVVRNEPLFASVDVLTDPDAPPKVKPEDAAEALQRLLRTVAADFKVVEDGWIERDGLRVYWMKATATTKGEKTTTLARVVVKDGRVWRVLAACPTAGFELLKSDLEKILESFRPE
ncbi:MAG: hypothetical protein K8T90_15430 [Planctomycetes bacterium]|nr:hypothetical protein [Planctomycetota bacterium]